MITKVSQRDVYPLGQVCAQARPSAYPPNPPNGEILSTLPNLNGTVIPALRSLNSFKDSEQSRILPGNDPSVLLLSLVDHGLSSGRDRLSFSRFHVPSHPPGSF